MDLTTSSGKIIVVEDNFCKLKNTALSVRKTIIVYNKTKKEDILNKCCRLCGLLLKDIDDLLK